MSYFGDHYVGRRSAADLQSFERAQSVVLVDGQIEVSVDRAADFGEVTVFGDANDLINRIGNATDFSEALFRWGPDDENFLPLEESGNEGQIAEYEGTLDVMMLDSIRSHPHFA